MDSGMFKPLQLAAIEALKQGPEWFEALNEEYSRRKVLAGEIFDMLGVEYDRSSTGMFLWGRVMQDEVKSDPSCRAAMCGDVDLVRPEVSRGQKLSDHILYEAGVFITPGFIFGRNGEDYGRISLCAKPETLRLAAERIRKCSTQ
jgi:aspartate/methionine/tyrosine aminotransferase